MLCEIKLRVIYLIFDYACKAHKYANVKKFKNID